MSITIHPLDLGQAETDTSFLVWGRTPGTRMRVPVLGYVILGAGDPIVVDTGGPRGHLEKGFHVFDRGAQQTLAAALARHYLAVEDVATLVITHLHSDHTGEIDALPNARIVLQRQELQYAAAPYYPATMFNRQDIAKLVGPLFDRVDPIEGVHDLTDGVRIVWTGGHSPGHQQVEVELDSGLAIITGDNAYLIDPSVTEGVPPGYVTSIPETIRALTAIKRSARHILPMHEPTILTDYPQGVK